MLSKRSDGFTLAELLVVVAIIAVLVAIAIPVFTSSLASAQEATCQANRRSMYAEVKVEAISKDLDEDGTKTFFDKLNGEKGPQGTSKVYTCPNNGVWSWTNGNISCSAHSGENEAGDSGKPDPNAFKEGSVSASDMTNLLKWAIDNKVTGNSQRRASLKDAQTFFGNSQLLNEKFSAVGFSEFESDSNYGSNSEIVAAALKLNTEGDTYALIFQGTTYLISESQYSAFTDALKSAEDSNESTSEIANSQKSNWQKYSS